MATALTPGRVYFVESENGVEDWITDHAGDPDDIDLDSFTGEGTDWCQIPIPKRWTIQGKTGTKVSTTTGDLQYSLRTAGRYYIAGASGIITTIASANLIDKFIMSDRHTSPSSTTFKPYYMIPYYGLNSDNEVPTFIDHNNTARAYCRGEFVDFSRNWVSQENSFQSLTIRFLSVWQ